LLTSGRNNQPGGFGVAWWGITSIFLKFLLIPGLFNYGVLIWVEIA